MPQLFIIDEKWEEQKWYNTGGTRAKKYLQAPDGKFYYFKRSQLKPGKDYRYEFWSEIIAYEIGTLLGFNILRYDVAIQGDVIGCISESMINSEEEELVEGVKYIQAFSPLYDPSNKGHQSWYTFQMIKNSLEKANLKTHIDSIVEIIIFDTLIGNGDRHQENWALINKLIPIHEVIATMETTGIMNKENRFFRWFFRMLKKYTEQIHKERKEHGKKMPKQLYIPQIRMAPVYDNGSSLGRELLDHRVESLLISNTELEKYIALGKAEIHWDNNKVSHFELIRQLMKTEYNQTIKGNITRLIEKWNGPKIEQIILEIDRLIPNSHNIYKIPDNRKQLIFKIITLRYRWLGDLLNEGI